METEELEIELIDEESEETFSTQKKRSNVWAHFKSVGNGENVICNHCEEKSKMLAVVTNLKRHLERFHSKIYKNVIDADATTSQKKKSKRMARRIASKTQKPISDFVAVSPVMMLAVNLAVHKCVTFNTFEHHWMKQLTNYAKKGAGDASKLCINANNVKASIVKLSQLRKQKIIKAIQGKTLSIIGDFATVARRAFLGLNVQFYDPNSGNVRLFNLTCKEVEESHNAANIKKWIIEELESFQIKPDQVFLLTVDSAANITKAVKDIVNHLNERVVELLRDSENSTSSDEGDNDVHLTVMESAVIQCGTDFMPLNEIIDAQTDLIEVAKEVVPEVLRSSSILVNCVVHKLQLGVNFFLWKNEKSTTDLINDAGKIVVKLRTPLARYKLSASGLKQPKLQVETRWDTVNIMLECLLQLKDFCLAHQEEPGFENLKISHAVWTKIADLQKALKLPAELTKTLQREDLLISDFIYFWFSMMLQLDALAGNSFAQSLKGCIKKREKQIFQNEAILAGWYLDKNLLLMPDLDDDMKLKAKKVIRMVYNKRNKLSGAVEQEITEDADIQLVDEPVIDPNVNPLDHFLATLGKASTNVSAQHSQTKDSLEKELVMYEKMETPQVRENTLKWWRDNFETFPILSPIALDILSAPVTEVTAERLFSHLNIVLDDHRSRLKGNLINDILFLRMNDTFDNKK